VRCTLCSVQVLRASGLGGLSSSVSALTGGGAARATDNALAHGGPAVDFEEFTFVVAAAALQQGKADSARAAGDSNNAISARTVHPQ
jgi:hypothetical protein